MPYIALFFVVQNPCFVRNNVALTHKKEIRSPFVVVKTRFIPYFLANILHKYKLYLSPDKV